MDRLSHCARCLEPIDPAMSVMFGVVLGIPNVALHLQCGFELLERWRAAAPVHASQAADQLEDAHA